MGWANDGLRFLLEMALLASLAYGGFSEQTGAVQWMLGLGVPLLVAVVWGRFIAPKASHPPTDPVRLLLEVACSARALRRCSQRTELCWPSSSPASSWSTSA
jgi:Protein of unknown function (DUF2568)